MAENSKIDPKVINLSTVKFSDAERSILSRGLKFCPTPKNQNKEELNNDIDDFCRKLRLKEYFHEKPMENISLVKCKSSWEPPSGLNQTLDKTINYLKLAKNIATDAKCKKSNLKYDERRAIASLKNQSNITIKEADKGSAVVLMDSNFYEHKIMDILNDQETYKMIPNNVDKTTINKIKTTLKKYERSLTKDEIKFLTNFEYKTSLFYGLPKVHKSHSIIKAIEEGNSDYIFVPNPSDLKMRPIVAGPACPTHRLSHLMDILLQPFLKLIPAYIKNNLDFLNKIPSQLSDSEIFVTLDVVSLYSNISHELGYKAINYWLENHYKQTNRLPSSLIMEGCKLILENNSFEFNGSNYLQISGTAMGTKFAPNYANLVLGYLENILYHKILNSFGESIANKIKNNYMRYLDDVFMVWDERDGNVYTILDLMNELDPKINFTCDKIGDTVTFLDIKIMKQTNSVITDIHYKATDTKQYLEYNSNHPRHVKNNIPFNLARRICTIVSEPMLRDIRLRELQDFLLDRNYPKGIINNGISRAKQISISVLRTSDKTTDNTSNDIIPYISTYNPNFNDHFSEVKSAITLLQTSQETKNIFKEVSLIKSKKQPSNLKNLLTKARFNTVQNQGVTKCGNPRCKLCAQIIEGNQFKFVDSNYTFEINHNMNCSTLNCIYVIRCNGCNSIYIGETSNLRLRTNLHRDHTKNKTGLYVNTHISKCAKDKYPNFNIMPFYKVKKDDVALRKSKESHFIKKFKPHLNKE